MKHSIYLLVATIILSSCGAKKINKDVVKNADTSNMKTVAVSVTEADPSDFTSYVNVQSQIVGDENVLATPQSPGIVKSLLVHSGQRVSKGQTLAILDAATVEQNIKALEPTLTLQKSLYEKQQKLWEQNIGTEVQLMQAKAQYEASQKQKGALVAQRDMYKIVSPINGTIDMIDVKQGEMASPGQKGIRVVNFDKLKAEANLGETNLGKIHTGDKVILVLPDLNDSIVTKLSYVSQAVDQSSRAFLVQVLLGSNKKLHPNMSCIMKIANYENKKALIVPVSVIQRTPKGDMLYIADGNKAKLVYVTAGHNCNGVVEILAGLNPGDKVVTTGFEELGNGQPLQIQ